MSSQKDIGSCETCRKEFRYSLIHNGFNDSAYAYCDKCGETCLLNLWQLPKGLEIKDYGVIPQSAESFLRHCVCEGVFRKVASPRCPHCNSVLSPVAAAKYIEANAPATKDGWRWQQTWEDLYCIIVEDRLSNDCWKEAIHQ